jgi:hypothetical protein
MRYATPLLASLCLLLASCSNAREMVDPEVRSEIPEGATAVKITVAEPPAEVYRTIYQALAREGFEISEENEKMGTLSTAMKDIGEGTTMAVSVFVEEQEGQTVATMRSKWFLTGAASAGMAAMTGVSADGGNAQQSTWGNTGRGTQSFGRLAEIASGLPYTNNVTYAKQ